MNSYTPRHTRDLPGPRTHPFSIHVTRHERALRHSCLHLLLCWPAGTGRSPSELLSEFGGSWRWSCGAGLVLPTPFGRFEANYCVLLSAQEHDRIKRGLQLGFAASSVA
jgi:hypothetical protein